MATTATMFIAVQCCQCSMMQVKQKRKSSSKWTCAVCNQKQSVRKVFAQGYMARDIRRFVQSFNFSLSQNGQQTLNLTLSQQDMPNKKLKLNTDGNGDGDGSRSRTPVGEGAPSKPPLLSFQCHDDMELKNQAATSNAASKWSKYMTEDDMEPKTHQAARASASASKWHEYMTEDNEEQTMAKGALTQDDMGPRSCQAIKANKELGNHRPTMGKTASKWNNYLMPDDDDDLKPVVARNRADDIDDCSSAIFETITHDQRVEDDDVHPDFI